MFDPKFSTPIHRTLDVVKDNIKFQLQGIPMYVPVWAGAPGMGKTSHAKKIADDLNMDILYVSMFKPAEYFSGIPMTNTLTFNDDEDRKKNSYAYWTQPDMIFKANEMSKIKDVIIFFDDLHIASPYVQSLFFELVLERSLGGFKLNDNIAMIGSMNISDKAGYDGFNSAIMNRLQMMHVHLDFEYWYANCLGDIHPLVATFLRTHGEFRTEEESINSVYATYRSWTVFSKFLHKAYSRYMKDGNKVNLLNYVDMVGRNFFSNECTTSLKASISEQIDYNFEGMVENNKYKLEPDTLSQLAFRGVLRYIKNKTQVKQFGDFLNKITSDSKNYRNALLGIVYEASAMINYYQNKKDTAMEEIILAIQYEIIDRTNKQAMEIYSDFRRMQDF